MIGPYERPMIYGCYWGVNLSKHENYPHRAGELYDCKRCESTCYCEKGFLCLYCELTAESVREEC